MRQHGYHVGADLVGHIAVGRHTIRPHDDRIDLSSAHQEAGHVVGDQGDGDVFLNHFPGRQPRALQERAGFIGDHLDALAGFNSGADDAERRAMATRGQRARVAMREHARAIVQQGGAVCAHGPVDAHVLGEDVMSLQQQDVGQGRGVGRA